MARTLRELAGRTLFRALGPRRFHHFLGALRARRSGRLGPGELSLIRDTTEAREYVESVRLFELPDFERMFSDAGLSLEQCFGDYEGHWFDRAQSPRLIMFVKR